MHSRVLCKWKILLQLLLSKPLTSLLLSKSAFWCSKLISFCSVWLGNGCRFLPRVPTAQMREGSGGHVSPGLILDFCPTRLSSTWPQLSPCSSNCGASSDQAVSSPASICMNHNCLYPIMQVKGVTRAGQGLTSEVSG